MNFTKEQSQAIELHGNSLLVSAAAGSGKTAVLTERVVEKLCADKPVDASRLMILTFTEAAAHEMRSRISKKLRERLKTHRDPDLIKRQISMLPQTQISTIHAACLSLIRKNFEQLGIDPRFSVAEEAYLTLMKKEALDDFVETLYEEAESDSVTKLVIDTMFVHKNDKTFVKALASGSAFLDKIPFARLFIDNIDKRQIIDAALEILKVKLKSVCDGYSRIATAGLGGVSEWFDTESYPIALVYSAVNRGDFDGAVEAARSVVFKNFYRPKDLPKENWPTYQNLRKSLKDAFCELRDKFLFANEAQMLSDRGVELPVLKGYLELCERFNEILRKRRLSERILSYDDLEKYTLDLLIESYDGKTLVKTDAARELSEFYEEIIVDEYQDCNLVQELIFCALSRDEKNIFAVGDVKQSIYRFRGAEPSLFLGRQKQSSYPEGDGELLQKTKIDLFCNFRSHKTVLDFINGIFYMLMSGERDIDYSEGHELIASDLYGESKAANVDMLLYVASDKKMNSATRVEAEAIGVARKIKQLIGKEYIYDTGEKKERLIRASDIAVIMRAPKTNGMIYERALEREGLSCINNNPSEKYLDTQEVREALAFLQVINNPYDDIPLITVMYSDYFNFTTDELGKIRAGKKYSLFYDAVREYAKTDKKTEEFLRLLTELRTLSLSSSLYGLISTMYEKTAILTRILTKKNGAKKRANLLMLPDLASGFESGGYKSLFSFITYLIKLSEQDEKMPVSRIRDNPDCIKLMSIHKSKGLEFPVVFFVNTTAKISLSAETGVILSPPSDAGGKITDKVNHRFFDGLAYNIIADNEKRDSLNEYMRLLYVALTRAGSRLYITGSLKVDYALELIAECEMSGGAPSAFDIETNASFFKWALLPYIRTAGANRLRAFAGLETVSGDKAFDTDVVEITPEQSDTETDQSQGDESNYRYSEDEIVRLITRNAKISDIPAKLSVSEIKNLGKSEKTATMKKPRFMSGGTTGADRGSATHKFLQFCNFLSVGTKEGFEKEKERLVDYEFITQSDADLVDKEGIIRFVNTDRMRSLISNYNMRKEERFMFSLPASEILDTDSNELVTLQGVLDCLFENGTEAVIVDYKTDRVSDENELIERYGIQLDMYARAIKINEGLETTEKLIYSFALEKFINV